MTKKREPIPVVDLFAGPGGLGEGFSAFGRSEGNPAFDIAVSMEMDKVAQQTLMLRSFYRKFSQGKVPDEYYDFVKGDILIEELYTAWPDQAKEAEREALQRELGKDSKSEINRQIGKAIRNHSNWILIGGPPCQAYSLIGRARLKGKKDYIPEEDHRHFLYQEYLRILTEHHPAVFVMENVKGILSSTVQNVRIFEKILHDLQYPVKALHGKNSKEGSSYRLFAFCNGREQVEMFESDVSDPREFVIYSERYSIPQARHRVIILGVRNDIHIKGVGKLRLTEPIPVKAVLEGLPRLRSGLSKSEDSAEGWVQFLKSASREKWLARQVKVVAGSAVRDRIMRAIEELRRPRADRGRNYIPGVINMNGSLRNWFIDDRLEGVLQHSTRGHMDSDLFRYFYASCFAAVKNRSPRIEEFPPELIPAHASASKGIFRDRFKVQLKNEPASTITSHISKDGHYYIHYDPRQCRSLTVREAARIQTFPDNYYFYGNRTQQYVQVGNAVPPLLAYQLAEIVADVLGVW